MKNIRYACLLFVLCAGHVSAATITVSAASSLKDAFAEIIARYEKQYPQNKVRLNTAASGALLQQAAQGAPVDVLAFADEVTMNQAQQKGVIDPKTRHRFALNTLVIATPKSSPLSAVKPTDLLNMRFSRIAIGNPASVPAGRYSKAAMEKAGLWNRLQPKIITTQNVRQSLDYIARGEVEAGFVYQTDVLLMKNRVKVVGIVPTPTPVAYPIAVSQSSRQPVQARHFIEYVLSAQGQKVLNQYGFKKP